MAFTTDDLDRVDQAIATGELEVDFADGRRVRYRSIASLRDARRMILGEITAGQGERRPTAFRVNVGKGAF